MSALNIKCIESRGKLLRTYGSGASECASCEHYLNRIKFVLATADMLREVAAWRVLSEGNGQ